MSTTTTMASPGTSRRPSLGDLTADKPSMSPGSSRNKSVKFAAQPQKQQQGPQDDFDKVMRRPLSREAAQSVMDTMGDTIKNPAGAAASEEERENTYWMIQNYKRAFKDKGVVFNNRVNQDSAMVALKKELSSVQNQISIANSKEGLQDLFGFACQGMEVFAQYYNPTGLDVRGLGVKGAMAYKNGYNETEISELAIKYSSWFGQGPELRALLGFVRLVQMIAMENQKTQTKTKDPKENVTVGEKEIPKNFKDL